MRPSDSLRRRIVVAYLIFAVGAALFFAFITAVAVEGIEVKLVDERLEDVAKWASPRHAGHLPVELPSGLSFHHGDAIPVSLRGLPPGVHEVTVDGIGLHVLASADADGNYVVVDHESDYEEVELVVYSLFAAALIGFLFLSTLLGRFVAKRLVTPISQLASAVDAHSAKLPLLDAKDEIGILARAFAAHTGELRQVLDRERFFTGDVSHELRSPLTVIMGAAEILLEQGRGRPELSAPAERIYRAAQEASECINVLLMLARAPALTETVPVSLALIARNEITHQMPLLASKPVTIRFDGGTDFDVAAQPQLCAAAVGNLIRNACQYTDSGSISVRLGERAVIVEDTGPGLPAAVRATLESRVNVNAMPSTGSAGTGLGLALVKRVCDYLGASLVFREHEGGGSVFIIQFPLPSQNLNGALTRP
jgi:signal transduction histidine kinase